MRLSEVLNADLAPARKGAGRPNAVPAPHLDRKKAPAPAQAPR